ncbi:DUF1835 domain-containing protein [Halobacillus seohaensis]|uniref:DUF1835 domain-containing protein n=1 Tax=Halobacillus seohaensis TaxID=447421 RepID=A0ABW2ER44_9BACI
MLIDELKRMVNHLEEEDAKSLLFQLLLRIETFEKQGHQEERFVSELQLMYREFLHYYKATQKTVDQDYQAVHIVFSDSTSGSLKNALSEMELRDEEEVIALPDTFSIGPTWRLSEKEGLNERYQWLEDHLIFEGEDVGDLKDKLHASLLNTQSIPSHLPIYIWTGNNAHEQVGLRLVMYLLNEQDHDIYLMQPELDHGRDCPYVASHTGELIPEKLMAIYKNKENHKAVSKNERMQWEEEWREIANSKSVLRIWKDQQIISVTEDYFDEAIINAARSLEKECEDQSFIKSAAIIGEVIGHLNEYIGDQFIEYRVRNLVMNEIFEIEGVLKGMRFYNVKLVRKKD